MENKMTPEEIFEMYKSLDEKEKIMFNRMMLQEEEYLSLEVFEKRLELAKEIICDIKNNNDRNKPTLQLKWIIENVLGLKEE